MRRYPTRSYTKNGVTQKVFKAEVADDEARRYFSPFAAARPPKPISATLPTHPQPSNPSHPEP